MKQKTKITFIILASLLNIVSCLVCASLDMYILFEFNLTLLLIFIPSLLYYYINTSSNYYINLIKNTNIKIKLILGIFYMTIIIYLERYFSLFILLLLLSTQYLLKDTAIYSTIKKDLVTLDYHLKKDFTIFFYLRYLKIGFLCYIFFLAFNLIHDSYFSGFVCCAFLILFFIEFFICQYIIFFKNTITNHKLLATCAQCVTVGTLTICSYLGSSEGILTTRLPALDTFQHYTLGYSTKSSEHHLGARVLCGLDCNLDIKRDLCVLDTETNRYILDAEKIEFNRERIIKRESQVVIDNVGYNISKMPKSMATLVYNKVDKKMVTLSKEVWYRLGGK